MPRNHMKADPTKTSLLRHAFERDVKRRANDLKKKITDALVVEDVFGLRLGAGPRIMKGGLQSLQKYAFQSDADKIKSFQTWVKKEVDDGFLELEAGADPATPWTSSYINSSYRKGIASSYIAGYGETAQEQVAFTDMSRDRFLQSTMASAVSLDRLAVLGTRTFEQMKGMTAQISQDLSRELSTGMAHGYGAKKLAKNISDNIDTITRKRGLLIARTEIIHAHAEGQLDALQAQGVEEVMADVEFSTAGDDRVCPMCAGLEGTVLTITQARGVIPVHPNCRCAWLPVIASRKTKKKSNTDAAIPGSKEGSIAHKINQVIDEIPRTPLEIADLSGVPLARVKAHMKWLQERKAVQELDGKWKMTDTALGAKKTIAGTKTKPVPIPKPDDIPTITIRGIPDPVPLPKPEPIPVPTSTPAGTPVIGKRFYPKDADGYPDTSYNPIYPVTIDGKLYHVTSIKEDSLGTIWHLDNDKGQVIAGATGKPLRVWEYNRQDLIDRLAKGDFEDMAISTSPIPVPIPKPDDIPTITIRGIPDPVPLPKPDDIPAPKPAPVPEPVPKPVPTPAPQPKPLPKPEAVPGAKAGSISEQINQAVGSEPRTPQEIADLSGATLARVKAHMKWLEARGRVKQVDGKWAMTDTAGVKTPKVDPTADIKETDKF